ncbi:MAG TPA: glycosyltransferase [Pyrinomonadaceae bacterium]|jgi:GT2 family glycosyltransferase
MKVLIGITTRDRASILPQAIESALRQDYADKEVAVFDDASRDETQALRERFPQVRWYRVEEPQGYLPARNRMMRETDAALYFSLDDDAWFIEGDELSRGVRVLRERPEIAALAYDILSPDKPERRERSAPRKTHMFIGCGHLLRLSAVREVNYYTPSPGFYGGEEKDLCVQLLDRSHEVMFLPGVHVWHDKAMEARDLKAQHRSGVCNDLVFALRRCPAPMLFWLLPGKMVSHFRFSLSNRLTRAGLDGMMMFLKALPQLLSTRTPVSRSAFREFQRRARAGSL